MSTVAISSFSILPTGMPVQPEITSPTICASTQTRISGFSPCSVSSSAFSASSSRAHGFGIGRGLGGGAVVRGLRHGAAFELAADFANPATRSRSFSQRSFSALRRASVLAAVSAIACQALGVVGADGGFALQHTALHGEIVERAL